jgi:UDP-N-acetyl-2-amino-2-deoxyglucuronate dehydrogenase
MRKLRFAVIGAGGMGSGHVSTLQAHPRGELVVACDVDEAALEPLSAAGTRTTTDWKLALDPQEVDAAIITLPHHLYPEVVNTALARGIHVLKEKPFARDLDDARAMLRAAEKSSAVLMVAGQGRYSAGYQRAKAIADSGVLGNVFLARGVITYRWGGAITDNWRWRGTRALSGGTAIIDSGWHILDVMVWLRGMPETVYCTTGQGNALPGDYDVDDRAVLSLEYADGGIASVICCFICLPSARQVFLHGTEASLEVTDSAVHLHRGDQENAEVTRFQGEGDLLRPQLDHFLALVDAGGDPAAGAREAYDVQRIIDAAYRSAASKRPDELAE